VRQKGLTNITMEAIGDGSFSSRTTIAHLFKTWEYYHIPLLNINVNGSFVHRNSMDDTMEFKTEHIAFEFQNYAQVKLTKDCGATVTGYGEGYKTVYVPFSFTLDPKHLTNSITNNLLNRFSQWASENKFYYGNPNSSDIRAATIPGDTNHSADYVSNDLQQPVYSDRARFIVSGVVTNEDGTITNYCWTNNGKNGYISRYVSMTNDYRENQRKGFALCFAYDNWKKLSSVLTSYGGDFTRKYPLDDLPGGLVYKLGSINGEHHIYNKKDAPLSVASKGFDFDGNKCYLIVNFHAQTTQVVVGCSTPTQPYEPSMPIYEDTTAGSAEVYIRPYGVAVDTNVMDIKGWTITTNISYTAPGTTNIISSITKTNTPGGERFITNYATVPIYTSLGIFTNVISPLSGCHFEGIDDVIYRHSVANKTSDTGVTVSYNFKQKFMQNGNLYIVSECGVSGGNKGKSGNADFTLNVYANITKNGVNPDLSLTNYSKWYNGDGTLNSIVFDPMPYEHFEFRTNMAHFVHPVTNYTIVITTNVVTNQTNYVATNIIVTNKFNSDTGYYYTEYITNTNEVSITEIFTNITTETNIHNDEININTAYGVEFQEIPTLLYPTDSRKYVAKTGIYTFVYNVPFPARFEDILVLNTNADFGPDGDYDKYDFSKNNAFIDPNNSYVNYGGYGVSYVTNVVIIEPVRETGGYYYRARRYLTNYNLATKGNGLSSPVSWIPNVPEEFYNISPEDINVDTLNVIVLDPEEENRIVFSTNNVKFVGIVSNGGVVELDSIPEISWSMAHDENLAKSGAALRSGTNAISDKEFNGRLKTLFFADAYKNYSDVISNDSLFWKTNGYVMENPWLFLNQGDINTNNIELYYLNGEKNEDLYISNLVVFPGGNLLNSYFTVGLKPGAEGRKIAEIKGRVNSSYELLYYDGKDFYSITNVYYSDEFTNTGVRPLAYWNITKLSGRYTLILKVYSSKGVKYSTQVVDIGEYSRPKITNHFITSTPYNRMEIAFPESFPGNTLVNVTPLRPDELTEEEIGGNIPDITPIGPILKVEPSPYDFGDDPANWPTISVRYTAEEATNLGLIGASPCIYTIGKNGIEALNTTAIYYQWVPRESPATGKLSNVGLPDDFDILQLTATANHFSHFFVLKDTNFSLPSPVIERKYLSNYVVPGFGIENGNVKLYYTRDGKISIIGRAAISSGIPDRVLCYRDVDPFLKNETPGVFIKEAVVTKTPPFSWLPEAGELTNYSIDSEKRERINVYEAGYFVLSNVALAEGTNYIIVKYDLDNSPADYIVIYKDSEGAKFVEYKAEEFVSPNGDGRKEKFNVSYTLDKYGIVNIGIYNRSGEELFSSKSDASNTGFFTWDCKNGMGDVFSDGLYDYRIETVDLLGNTSESKIGSFRIDTNPPTLTLGSSYCRINLEGNGMLDWTSDEPVRLTGELYRNGTNVKTIAMNDYASEGTLYISGSDDLFNPLPDGTYSLRVMAFDRAENQGISKIAEVVIDRTMPVLSEPLAFPGQFMPGNSKVRFSFFASEAGIAELELHSTNTNGVITPNPLGEYIGMIRGEISVEAGENSVEWDGMLSGKPIAAGMYYAVVRMKDLNGNSAVPKKGEFEAVIDRTPPSVVYFTLSTNRIGYEAGRVGAIEITYAVTDNIARYDVIDTSVAILDSLGRYVAILKPYTKALTNRVYWYGRSDAGNYVSDGRYYARIEARDDSGNSIVSYTVLPIIVDNCAPLIAMYQFKNPYISPGTPEGVQKSIVKLKLSESDGMRGEVAIRKNGMLMKEIFKGVMTNNDLYTFEWDGRFDSGEIAIEGAYDLMMDIEDYSGNITSIKEKVTVDITPPEVLELTISGNPFSPNGDRERDVLPVEVTGKDNLCPELTYNFSVKDRDGNTIRNWSTNSINGATAGTLWDGRDNENRIVRDGIYAIEAKAIDLAGNCSVEKSIECEVDNTPPDMPYVSVNPGLFSPGESPNVLDETVLTNRTMANEEVAVTHTIEGESLPFSWEAKGTGVYYPITNATVTVQSYGYVTNYIEVPVTNTLIVSGFETRYLARTNEVVGISNVGIVSLSNNVSVKIPWTSTQNGLYAEYYNGTNFNTLVATRIDPNVDFNWGDYKSPIPVMVNNEYFSIRWTGYIKLEKNGIYQLSNGSDDGMRVYVNNRLVVDKWILRSMPSWDYFSITNNAGTNYCPISIEYFEGPIHAEVHLIWKKPGDASFTPVPQSAFLTTPQMNIISKTPLTMTNVTYLAPLSEVVSIPQDVINNAGTVGVKVTNLNPYIDIVFAPVTNVSIANFYSYPKVVYVSNRNQLTNLYVFARLKTNENIGYTNVNYVAQRYLPAKLTSTNLQRLGNLSNLVSIPENVFENLNGIPVSISCIENPNVLFGICTDPNITDIGVFLSTRLTNISITKPADLANYTLYAVLAEKENFSYVLSSYTNTKVVTTNITGLKNVAIGIEADDPVNSVPANGVRKGWRFITEPDVVKVIGTNYTSSSNLISFVLTNEYSEGFATTSITAENRGITYCPSGTKTSESVFDYYSYPSNMDGGLIRITNWKIDLFKYGAGGAKVAASEIYVSNVYTSLNGTAMPGKRNGDFEVWAKSLDNLVFHIFNSEEVSTNGEEFVHSWYGTNDNTGMVLPDGVYYSRVYTRDRAYNKNAVSTPIEIDNTKPLVMITSPVANSTVGDVIRIEGSILDKNLKEYSLGISNGGMYYDVVERGVKPISNGLIAEFDTLGLVNNRVGENSILIVSAIDKAGNDRVIMHPLRIYNEDDAIFRIVKVENKVLSENGTLRVTYYYSNITLKVSDDAGHSDTIVYSTYGTNVLNYKPEGLAEGVHTLTFVARLGDRAVSRNVTFEVDNTKPFIALENITNGQVVRGVVEIIGSIRDSNLTGHSLYISNSTDGSVVKIEEGKDRIESSRIGLYSTTGINANSPFAGTNVYVLKLVAFDEAGNTNTLTRDIYIDNAKPYALMEAGKKGRISTIKGDVEVGLTLQDVHLDGAVIQYKDGMERIVELERLDNPISGRNNLSIDFSMLSGNVPIVLIAYDIPGNTNVQEYVYYFDGMNPAINNLVCGDVMRELKLSAVLSDDDAVAYYEIGIEDSSGYRVLEGKELDCKSYELMFESALDMPEMGKASVVLKVRDIAGNETVTNIPFTVDYTAPVVRIINPVEGSVFKDVISFNGVVVDENAMYYRILMDGVVAREGYIGHLSNNIELSLSTSLLSEGRHTLTLEAIDKAGNASSEFVNIVVDRLKPVIALSAKKNGVSITGPVCGMLDFYISCEDENPLGYRLGYEDGIGEALIAEGLFEGEYKERWIGSLDSGGIGLNGIKQFRLMAYDKAGNSNSVTLTLDIDNEVPVLAWAGVEGGNILNLDDKVKGMVKVKASLNDVHSMDYEMTFGRLTNRGYSASSGTIEFLFDTDILEEGGYPVTLKAIDEAGNESSIMRSLIVDRTPPVFTIDSVPDIYSPYVNSGFNIGLSSDEIARINRIEVVSSRFGTIYKALENIVVMGGSTNIVWDGRIDGEFLPTGYYRVKLYGIDSVGNESEAVSKEFLCINDPYPPVVTILETNLIFSAYQNPFVLKYEAMNDGADISNIVHSVLTIENSEGMSLKLYDRIEEAGIREIKWNGRNEEWEIMPDGNYIARLKVSDFAGNTTTMEFNVVLDSTMPVISSVSVEPVKISKNHPVKNKSIVNVSFEDNESISKVIYNIYKYEDILVKSETNDVGLKEWVLNRMFAEQEHNDYTLEFVAFDRASNVSVFNTNVVVDNYGPYLQLNMWGNYIIVTNEIFTNGTNILWPEVVFSTNGVFWYTTEADDLAHVYYGLIREGDPMELEEKEITNYITLEGKTDGKYLLVAVGEDDIENRTTNIVPLTVDGTGPNLTYSYTATTNEPMMLNGKKYISFENVISASASDLWGVEGIEVKLFNNADTTNEEDIEILPVFETPVFETNYIGASNISFSLASLGIKERGEYRMVITAYDRVLNPTTVEDVFNVPLPDLTPPESRLVVIGPHFEDNGVIYISTNASIAIEAEDKLGPLDGYVSGVDRIMYSINGAEGNIFPWQEYDSPIRFSSDGNVEISFYAVDKLGNVENTHTVKIVINSKPPKIGNFRSLVVDRNTILYEWDAETNRGLLFNFSTDWTNCVVTNNSFALSNINLEENNMLLYVEARVKAINLVGISSEELTAVNILDDIIDIRQPATNSADYYRGIIPVYARFNTHRAYIGNRAMRKLSYYAYEENDRTVVPTNWTVVMEDNQFNSKRHLRAYIMGDVTNRYGWLPPVWASGWWLPDRCLPDRCLPDGKYLVRVDYSDIKGNVREDARIAQIDRTRPIVKGRINGVEYEDVRITITNEGELTLEGIDPISNGVASGIKHIFVGMARVNYGEHHYDHMFEGEERERTLCREFFKDAPGPDWMDRPHRGDHDGFKLIIYEEPIKLTNEGRYYITYVAEDNSDLPYFWHRRAEDEDDEFEWWRWPEGNLSEIHYLIVDVVKEVPPVEEDTTPPEITVRGIGEEEVTNRNLQITINVSDNNLLVNRTSVVVDGVYMKLKNNEVTFSLTTEGKHTISVTAEDKFHNIANYYKEIVIDKTAPVVQIVNILEGHNYLGVKPLVEVKDNYSSDSILQATLVKDKKITNVYYGTWSASPLSELNITNIGQYELTIRAIDEADNSSIKGVRFNIVTNREDTLLLYAGFNLSDSAIMFYGNGNNILKNTSGKPVFVKGIKDYGIMTHALNSAGVSYSIGTNGIWNPGKGSIEMSVLENIPVDKAYHGNLTLFEMKSNTTSVLSIYLDKNHNVNVRLGNTNFVVEMNKSASTKCAGGSENSKWYKLRVAFDLNPAGTYSVQGKPYVRIYINDELKKEFSVDVPQVKPLNVGAKGRLFAGYGEDDRFYINEYMYIDELKLYEEGM